MPANADGTWTTDYSQVPQDANGNLQRLSGNQAQDYPQPGQAGGWGGPRSNQPNQSGNGLGSLGGAAFAGADYIGNTGPGFQYNMADAGNIQKSVNNTADQYNTGYVDPAKMPVSSVGMGDPYMQKMQDAYYNQATARLDPQWQQRQSGLENQLANMGLTRGSEAWNREMQNMSGQRNDAYGSAMNQAIMNSGQEAQRLQGMDIAGGNFANQAAQQNYENQLTSQGAQNKALGDQFNQNLAAGQFGNQSQNQQFTQNQNAANLQNSATTAQQNAAQGWGQMENQRWLTKNAPRGTTIVGSGMSGGQVALGQAQLQLQQQQQQDAQRLQDFNMTNTARMQPILEMNALQGNYNYSNPSFANYGQASYPTMGNSSGYSQGLTSANNQTNSGYGDILSSLGGFLPF